MTAAQERELARIERHGPCEVAELDDGAIEVKIPFGPFVTIDSAGRVVGISPPSPPAFDDEAA